MTKFNKAKLDYQVSCDLDFQKMIVETSDKIIGCKTSDELVEILINFSDEILNIVDKYI